jgi:hypothetical protein
VSKAGRVCPAVRDRIASDEWRAGDQIPTIRHTATLAAGGAWNCTIQGNFNLRSSPGGTSNQIGAALKKGDHVQILGWSRAIDGSSDIPWFEVITADGRTGWIINSAPGPNNSRIDYPTCNFKCDVRESEDSTLRQGAAQRRRGALRTSPDRFASLAPLRSSEELRKVACR